MKNQSSTTENILNSLHANAQYGSSNRESGMVSTNPSLEENLLDIKIKEAMERKRIEW